MKRVKIYDQAEDELLKFAVIIARYRGQWVFCKHWQRDTLEVPGGHREPGEDIEETARRELWEETGATDYTIRPVCVYSVSSQEETGEQESFGGLYFAEIEKLERELHSEIEKIILTDELPGRWTYPDIQPELLAEAGRRGFF